MRFDTTMLASKRHVALSVLLPFLVATLSLPVQLGRSSVNLIEIVGGLHTGDKVILSDMSQWDANDRIKLN